MNLAGHWLQMRRMGKEVDMLRREKNKVEEQMLEYNRGEEGTMIII